MTTWGVLFNNTEEKLVGYQASAVSARTKRTLSDWSVFDFLSRKLGIKACDTKQKCHVLTKPEIKYRLVNTVPCLRRNKYNLVLIRHTFLVLFYYKICFISYYFILFAVKQNTTNTRRGEIVWHFLYWLNRSWCKYLESSQILQGLMRSLPTCRPLCDCRKISWWRFLT